MSHDIEAGDAGVSGHVFHPGHSDLHGITVVVETTAGRLLVGRYHEATERGVLLHDVAERLEEPGQPAAAEFIARLLKFGVRAQHPHILVPSGEISRITRLVEWS